MLLADFTIENTFIILKPLITVAVVETASLEENKSMMMPMSVPTTMQMSKMFQSYEKYFLPSPISLKKHSKLNIIANM